MVPGALGGIPYTNRKFHPTLRAFGARAARITLRRDGFVTDATDRLALEAEAGKALQGDLKGLRSLRLARFRVIYRAPARRVIGIVAIGPRDRIYEETLRLVSAERGR